MGLNHTCPSANCAPGATLLGTLGDDGRIHNMRSRVEVSAEFAAEAARLGPPEARMRFAAPCQEGGCGQWTGEKCGIIEKVMSHLEQIAPPAPVAAPGTPQPCVIRATCRWFDQRGADACSACSMVVTDQKAATAA